MLETKKKKKKKKKEVWRSQVGREAGWPAEGWAPSRGLSDMVQSISPIPHNPAGWEYGLGQPGLPLIAGFWLSVSGVGRRREGTECGYRRSYPI